MPTIYTPSSIPLRIPFAPNRGFNFTKPIRVTNLTTKLTDYQIVVNLNTSNFAFEKARPDGADIRFQDANGKALSYWIENWTSTNAKIWVKLDELEAYEDRIIWLIYGNYNAKSETSFDDTFIFGELWDNAALNTTKWSTVSGNPTYSINTANNYLEVTDIDDGEYAGYGFYSKTLSFPTEYIIEAAKGTGGFNEYLSFVTGEATKIICGIHHMAWSNTDYGIAFSTLWTHSSLFKYYKRAGIGGNLDYTSASVAGGGPVTVPWTIYKLAGNIVVKEGATIRVNEANSETPDRFFIGQGKITNFGTVRMYGFKIRNYSSTPPLVEIL